MDNKLEKKVNTERRRAGKRRLINQDIYKVSIFFALIFFALVIFLVKYLAFDAGSVINNTYNKRSDSIKKTVQRGSIYSAGGDVLAYTQINDDGSELRIYPYGEDFFHVVGFEDKGGMGIESSYNYYMLTSHDDIFSKISGEFTGSKVRGDNIVTTLDLGIQQKLNEILGDNEGAIVVIDPATGEVKGMVSKPGYDPNYINEAWEEITSDENNSLLLNRVTQGAFTPGSTFKIFTLLEYYREKGGAVDSFYYDCTGSLTVGDDTVRCPSGIAHGGQDLRLAFANSCNCVFSSIGLGLDLDLFSTNNNALLFNKELDIDIASGVSSFSLGSSSERYMIMHTCFGQGETLITPMHLAMVTCSIANDGVLMKPHLVTRITDSQGNTVKTFSDSVYSQLMSSDEAAFMKDYMRGVVTDGTARILSYEGNYISYGKTGTAETMNNKDENHDHSWFTGFAENNGTTLVVCAMIENTQEAGITGVYAAKQLFDYYFGY